MDKPLRLLIVGTAWPMETFLDRLLRGLANEGFQITLASGHAPDDSWLKETRANWLPAPMWRGFSLKAITQLGANTLRASITAHSDARLLWQLSRSESSLSFRLASWFLLVPFAGKRWDVVYVPWNFHAITYLPLFSMGMPVVLSCRGSQMNIAPYNPRRSHSQAGLRLTLERAAAVHCVSQEIVREAQRWGLDPGRARVIHPAVAPDYFKPILIRPDPGPVFRVVTTGSLIWLKGLEYALLAVKLLADAGVPVCFEIIGDGPDRNRVLYTIHDLGLSQIVTMKGKLKPVEVLHRLQLSHAFLLSSLSEGISNAVLEAMACGLPVVTSDCGGMREAVTDGMEGFVTPLRDPEAMAQALLRLWESPDLRSRMGSAGRQRIIREFSLENQVQEFAKLFQGVAMENFDANHDQAGSA